MNEDVTFLMKYRSKGALMDATLLLVYTVGKTDRTRLSHLHYTKQYEHDFDLIERIVELFPTVYTTPNVLTEISNLGKKLGTDFFDTLGRIISVLDEKYCRSRDAVAHAHFQKLGLTDAGLCTLAAKFLVVTADFPLYQILRANNLDVVNFHHLRPLGWSGLKLFTS
jgi:hypothetical protein